jgi:hypothetical protein
MAERRGGQVKMVLSRGVTALTYWKEARVEFAEAAGLASLALLAAADGPRGAVFEKLRLQQVPRQGSRAPPARCPVAPAAAPRQPPKGLHNGPGSPPGESVPAAPGARGMSPLVLLRRGRCQRARPGPAIAPPPLPGVARPAAESPPNGHAPFPSAPPRWLIVCHG